MKEKNLLIIGAGIYGLVAYEIATDMRCFDKIGFADDTRKLSCNGIEVEGGTEDLRVYTPLYTDMIVAIGNPDVRLSLIDRIKEETECNVTFLISPKAYVSSSSVIAQGCIIEPMAVIHSNCVLSRGCIVSAGAVINHATKCGEGVHIDCNATVSGNCEVPSRLKLGSGVCFKGLGVKRCDDSYSFDVGI